MDKKGVKFVRIRGKVVPIREKGAQYMEKTAQRDAKLASTGNKMAAASLGIATAGIATIKLTKFKKAGIVAGVAGVVGALTNNAFASGRAMSSKDRKDYAEQLRKGQKIKRGKGFGGASERAYGEAKMIEKYATKKKK
jgi:hypothetical protein